MTAFRDPKVTRSDPSVSVFEVATISETIVMEIGSSIEMAAIKPGELIGKENDEAPTVSFEEHSSMSMIKSSLIKLTSSGNSFFEHLQLRSADGWVSPNCFGSWLAR